MPKNSRTEKKHTVFNRTVILYAVFFILFLGFAETCALNDDIGMCVTFSLFCLLPIVCFLISPIYYVFSKEGVVIVYNFRIKEQIKWSEIRNISSMGSWNGVGGFPHYVISYPKSKKYPFFVVGEVIKTARTTKLIKRYYKKEIT